MTPRPSFTLVEPMPPYCAVSEANDLSHRLVVITGENLIAGEEPHVQLRNRVVRAEHDPPGA